LTERIIRQFGNSRNDLSRTSCVKKIQNMLGMVVDIANLPRLELVM